MQSKGTTSGRGFTLIELLTVMSVIAVLVAMIFPLISFSLSKSKRTFCLNNVKQIGMSFQQYAADNKGVLPYALGGTALSAVTMNSVVTTMAADGSLVDPKIWICPSDTLDGGGAVGVTVAASLLVGFNSIGNCSYAYLFGLGDKSSLPPGGTPVLVDESNLPETGPAPQSLQNLQDEDNHGSKYRNVIYFDYHAVTLPIGTAATTYEDSLPPDDAAGASAWAQVIWLD